jgi:phosphotransferase system HPr (HPr) family protein
VSTNSDREVRLPDGVALHARPAGLFVKTALKYRSQVWVAAGGREADAKSIMSVLGLGAKGGSSLTVRALGDDAEAAVDALAVCVAGLVE